MCILLRPVHGTRWRGRAGKIQRKQLIIVGRIAPVGKGDLRAGAVSEYLPSVSAHAVLSRGRACPAACAWAWGWACCPFVAHSLHLAGCPYRPYGTMGGCTSALGGGSTTTLLMGMRNARMRCHKQRTCKE